MEKEEILSRLGGCIDKSILDAIKVIFEHDTQLTNTLKSALSLCTDTQNKPVSTGDSARKYIQDNMENRDFRDAQNWART